MQNKYKNLFLQQSYLDATELYERSLSNSNISGWDYVILSASNEAQAEAYRSQIEFRLSKGRLQKKTHFEVISDLDGKRIGSGGATLNILKYVREHSGLEDLSSLKILVLHSGGDSKRTPQYSACGKIFSPVPRLLSDGNRSTLFDEFLIALSGIPARISGGMMVCSGDVLLLFNTLQLDFYGEGAAAISIKENVETGKNHGVFLGGKDGNVKKFLHKQSVEQLYNVGAVDAQGRVDLDTGAVIFSGGMVNTLFSLINTDKKFNALVNEKTRLSFYADFLYPLAEDSTLKDFYNEQPEGEFTHELKKAREILWDALRKYRMKLMHFVPASFLHFGTTKELLNLMTVEMPSYKFLNWSGVINSNYHGDKFAVSNSYISRRSTIGNGSYIEDSYIHSGAVVGENCVISGVTLDNVTVPDNTVLHGLKLKDGRFVVRMYGINDNPKENKWLSTELDGPLWDKPLFTPKRLMADAVKSTLESNICSESLSLKESFELADVTQILPWQTKLDDKVKTETFLEAIDNSVPVAEFASIFKYGISGRVKKYLLRIAEKLDRNDLEDFGRKMRIYYYLSKFVDRENMENKCFDTICGSVLNAAVKGISYNKNFRIKEDETVTSLPVRVNWGGGWSDTPPFCLEHGGKVLNAAITLDSKMPIEVTLKRVEENKIILASTDIGSYKEFSNIEELQNCSDPSDAFALHKAALIACGVIPREEAVSVEEICKNLGLGFYMNTRVINIPKGSGLGTSSILAGACVKGIYKFLGIEVDDNELYNRVLSMEQLMSTGGGWQDQVGGLANGIKLVSAEPGLEQRVICEKLELSDTVLNELNERFAVIYTGQRRLARNLLREVVGKYIGNNPTAKFVLFEIQKKAEEMKEALEKGNIDGFATLLSEHWELSKKLDMGCTNTCIDQIFLSIEDLIDGKMICGAGGGGFIQVVLKKGVSKEMLKNRLYSVFADSGVGVWDSKII